MSGRGPGELAVLIPGLGDGDALLNLLVGAGLYLGVVLLIAYLLVRGRGGGKRSPGSGATAESDPAPDLTEARGACGVPDDATQLWDAISSRGITALYHFTHIENLPRIMKSRSRGIVARSVLEEQGRWFRAAGERRLDGRPGYVSLSISHPNYRMLYSKSRRKNQDSWIVLEIDPYMVLTMSGVLFFPENAASSHFWESPDGDFLGFSAFSKCFADFPDRGHPSIRSREKLRDCEPTNPQCEVLVPTCVRRDAIRRIHTAVPVDLYGLHPGLGHRAWNELYTHSPALFGPRKDWRRWSSR